ncbi:hypothetical protein BDV25DRAFT_164008 [Aspergillus avenaceus]|uniref:Septin-type G domain-containing protein n=1 Tax=Aspergillus avenaceus TaxID=36643 RepID=A0A5N6TH70_ASPAV|nr:hypothetical protein BDV25DRAFT_164008 [Aspergillus avenaceus]
MRPPVPDVSLRRSRKSSIEQQWIDPRNNVPTTFFLARSRYDVEELSPDDPVLPRHSMYGVQSLEEAVQNASFTVSECEPDFSTAIPLSQPLSPRDQSDIGEDDITSLYPRKSTLRPDDLLQPSRLDVPLSASQHTSPRPLTPSNLSIPDNLPSSLPSSPKSFTNQSLRHLDDISISDDLSSQAVASGEEDNDLHPPSSPGPDSTSQLVMPSIKMPSRRPFTDRGKSMGRLKLLIAGAPGTGKSSLIESIVQVCEDIVHVDPFPPKSPARSPRSSRPFQTRSTSPTATEVYASTKPYPAWWSGLEDSRILRRRKSTGEIVLERNLCFVDTHADSSHAKQNDNILLYIKQQLLRVTTSLHASNHDFQNLLAGNGGAQVDAVLYLISEDTLSTDIECIRQLCDWANVIPLISKSDLLTPDRISALKSAFHEHAQRDDIKLFLGDASLGAQTPFAISSAKSDDDTMDASTLMSPDYVQPLVTSELTFMVQTLLDRENMIWIRHSAAKKLALRQQEPHWQRVALESDLFPANDMTRNNFPSYTMARVSDYTRHEERIARVQLAKWASDLQQSLQNERERYSAIAKRERAVWLTERLGDCIGDGSLVPITQPARVCGLHMPMEKAGSGLLIRTENGQQVEYCIARASPHDPLGLVWWSEDLKRRSWTIVQIVGSFGVVGGLAFWLAKSWGVTSRGLGEWRYLEWYGTSR